MKKMKNSVANLGRRAVRVVKRTPKAPQGRITNDTITEHRAHILTSGRRFKYPMQYARHKLVINTILLSIGVVVLLAAYGAWQLYSVQTSSGAFYRITQALPLPVASVDGTPVRYSDYLMRYRSEIYWLTQNNQINTNTVDGKRQAEYRKRQALSDAEATAYASKIARQKNIMVGDQAVNAFIEQARRANGISISVEAYYAAQADAYNWTKAEVRDNIRNSLLKREVAFSVDDLARTEAGAVATAAAAPNADFGALTTARMQAGHANITTADAGTIPLNSEDPSGIIAAIRGFNPGQVSGLIRGVDGYYVAKLLEKSSTTIHYSYVKIGLTQFTDDLAKLKQDHKIQEYITVKDDANTAS
jgi:hypothetical protein